MKRIAALLVGMLVSVYVVGGVWLYATQDAVIFPQMVNSIQPPDFDNPAGLEYLTLHTPDGATLNGLGFNTAAGQGNSSSTPHPTTLVLAFGGNAHDVTGMVRFLHRDVFPEATVAVAGLSYRGYLNALGRPSTGTPSQRALQADAVQLYDTLVARLKPTKVVVVGYSLGSAVGAYVARWRTVESLILAAPFASITALAQAEYRIYPASLMVLHPFDTASLLANISSHISVVYSPQDGLIPPTHPFLLQTANPKAQLIPLNPAVPHGDVLDHPTIPALFRTAAGM
ncbi:MAG: hypothetical protein WAZ18_03455 [Alphaproteobacteria bacterium]